MSTIRIFSKAAFSFGPGAQRGTDVIDNFVTVPGSFQDMPEKYASDPTFKRAVQFHEVEIIEKHVTAQVPKVEVNAEENKNEEPEVDPVEKFYEELRGMNKEQTEELAKKYGAKFVEGDALKMNKKRVMEAYKLSISEE